MHYVKSSDGAKIAVYDMNHKTSKTIILIHGWPLSHKMFEYQINPLLESGYRIIRMDIRGFGNSDETDNGFNYDQFATDLCYVIYALNLTSFDLLGFSMGGAIVTRYMAMYNGYGVRKLCLCNAAVPSYCKTENNPYGQTIEDTNKLIELGYNDRPALNEYFGNIFFAKEHSKAFKKWLQNVNNSASGSGEMKSLIALRDENVFNDLKSIDVPTGIFHGKEDKICSFEMAKIVNSNISNSKLFLFENAGHGAFYDDKDKFNKELLKFLNGK